MSQGAEEIVQDSGDAARMNGIYQYQRYFYDATRKYYLLGRDHLLANLAPESNGKILEIGCGTGRNLISTAKQYKNVQLFGFDISSAMLETAAQSINKAGLSKNIHICQADATIFESKVLFGIEGFERVYISYTLSMIPVWRAVLPKAIDALCPNGELHIVDFGQLERLPRWFRNLLYAWLERFSVHPSAELRPALVALAKERALTLEFSPLYRGYATYAVLKRHA